MARASVKDVAARAGLSVGTVSNVLNRPDKVSEATRTKVLEAIEELGFVRNEAARQLRAGFSQCVGLVVLDASNPFFHDLAAGVEQAADEAGLQVLLANSGSDPEREARSLRLFDQQRVRGVLVSPVRGATPEMARLSRRGTRVVVVDAHTRDHSSISVDDELGGRLAAGHLIELGHSRLCYVGGPASVLRQDADRLSGAAEAVAGWPGVTLEHLLVAQHTIHAGRAAADQLLGRSGAWPTGVFCANDLLALGFLQGVTARGLRVPDDLALVGYDDIIFAAGAAVPLSSVRQPRLEMGRRAMEVLHREIEDPTVEPTHVILEPDLVVRQSSAGKSLLTTGDKYSSPTPPT